MRNGRAQRAAGLGGVAGVLLVLLQQTVHGGNGGMHQIAVTQGHQLVGVLANDLRLEQLQILGLDDVARVDEA